jgi:hypothetical protein
MIDQKEYILPITIMCREILGDILQERALGAMKLLHLVYGLYLTGGVHIRQMILCECGEFIDGGTFRDYIETTSNPSTPTIGHRKCGLIFNFIDDDIPKRYSSKEELKSIALKFIEKNKMDDEDVGRFLLEVDRLKCKGIYSDNEILARSIRILLVGTGLRDLKQDLLVR